MDGRAAGPAGRDLQPVRGRRSLVVGSALGLVILLGLVAVVGPGAIIRPLAGAAPGYVGLAAVAGTGVLGCRHLAYRHLCRRTAASPVGARFHLYLLVAGVPRWLLPFGYVGGPVINATYLQRGVGARFEPTAAALAVSELLAIVTSGFVLGTGFLLVLVTGGTLPVGNVSLAGGTFVLLSVFAVVLFVFVGGKGVASLARNSGPRIQALRAHSRIADAVARVVERFVGLRLRRFAASLSAIAADRRTVATVAIVNGLGWTFGVIALYVCARAVGLPVPVGIAMVTVPLAATAGMIPVPGGIGPTELAVAGLLVALAGAAPATATATALLYRLSTVGVELLGGGLASAYVLASAR